MIVNDLMSALDQEEAEMRARIGQARAHAADLIAEAEKLDSELAQMVAARALVMRAATRVSAAEDEGQTRGDEKESGARRANDAPAPGKGADGHQSYGRKADLIISVIGTSGRSWKAREVAEAIEGGPVTRDQVHSTRNNMARLTELGVLVRAGAGLYAIAAGWAGAR